MVAKGASRMESGVVAREPGCLEPFSFCGKPQKHTPIFESAPLGNTASVNAGDYNLYVGGGAINRAFANLLQLGADNAYQRLHSAILERALATPGQLARASDDPGACELARELGLAGCFARVPDGGGPARGPVGSAFLGVFEATRRPLSPRNVAMLYAVGPKGRGARGGHGPTVGEGAAFLQAVEGLGANCMMAVKTYNALVAAKNNSDGGREALPRIDIVQWCLVSGGVYRHPETSKLDVAVATVRGLLAGARSPSGGSAEAVPRIRFAYDEGVFEKAVRSVMSS